MSRQHCVGGAASAVAMSLAAAGVGDLHVVDFDSVEPFNLVRRFPTPLIALGGARPCMDATRAD